MFIRLRLVLRHRSDLDEVIKSLNEQLDDVETQLSYTEQLTDTKEVGRVSQTEYTVDTRMVS